MSGNFVWTTLGDITGQSSSMSPDVAQSLDNVVCALGLVKQLDGVKLKFNKNLEERVRKLLQQVVGLDEDERRKSQIARRMEHCLREVISGYIVLVDSDYTSSPALESITKGLLQGLLVENKLTYKLYKELHNLLVTDSTCIGTCVDDTKFYSFLDEGIRNIEACSYFIKVFSPDPQKSAEIDLDGMLGYMNRSMKKTKLQESVYNELLGAMCVRDDHEFDNPIPLQTARWCETNLSSRFKNAMFNVKKVAAGKGGVTKDIEDKFTECTQELKSYLKEAPNDSNYTRDAYKALAFMYMFTKDEHKAKVYYKQALYAAARVPSALVMQDPRLDNMNMMLGWKFPGLQLRDSCDECDASREDGGVRKVCPCGAAYYCQARCQKKHWKIHKHVCSLNKK